jgi:hypothetical protein
MAGALAAARGERYSPRVFLPLALPFAILAAVGVFALVNHSTPQAATPAPGQYGSLVWGDGIFARPFEMKAWLQLHGGSYRSWAKQHPAGVALIRPQIFRPPATARSHAAKKKPLAPKP